MKPAMSTRALLPAAAFLLAALVPTAARTQSEGWDPALAAALSGTWTLAVSQDAARAALDAGIEPAVAGLPPLVNSMAASRIRERTVLSRSVSLSLSETSITARFVHATFTSAPGAPIRVPVPGDEGETMEMVQLLRGGAFEQIFTTDGGRRWSTFTPSADGTRLELSVVIHSDQLSADVRFRLPYRRSS